MLSGEMLEGVEKLYGAAGDSWKYAKMADGSWKVMDTTKPDFGWITPNAAQVKAIEAQLTEEGDERGFKLTEEPMPTEPEAEAEVEAEPEAEAEVEAEPEAEAEVEAEPEETMEDRIVRKSSRYLSPAARMAPPPADPSRYEGYRSNTKGIDPSGGPGAAQRQAEYDSYLEYRERAKEDPRDSKGRPSRFPSIMTFSEWQKRDEPKEEEAPSPSLVEQIYETMMSDQEEQEAAQRRRIEARLPSKASK
jgi:hypothetical protein